MFLLSPTPRVSLRPAHSWAFSIPCPSCSDPPPPTPSLLWGGAQSRPGKQVSCLGDVCELERVVLWRGVSLHLSWPLPPTFIVVVGQEAEWVLQTRTCSSWGRCPLAGNRGDVAGQGTPASFLVQAGAAGTLGRHYIYGDTEAERAGDFPRAPD